MTDKIETDVTKAYELFKLYKRNPKEYEEFIEFLNGVYMDDMSSIASRMFDKAIQLEVENGAKSLVR